jgi:hypothetical protein
MKRFIKAYWIGNPLMVIMILAIFVRLIAVIFAKGFGMHDDHFLVVEIPQSWVDGLNNDNWLPSGKPGDVPSGHSLLYPGIQFVLLSVLKWLHISDPQLKMLILRFINAVFSLITVYYGYKITEKISNPSSAKTVGLMLALFWLMPWLSVRNLVEIICIPFLILGVWIILQQLEKPKPLRWIFLAGLLFGIAFSLRFQTIFFTGGIGLALLFKLRWKEMLVLAFGTLFSITLIQCIPDMLLWGYPFAEFGQYVKYNWDHQYSYLTGSPLLYLEFLLGIFIFPMGLFWFFGFFRSWKKLLLLFLPTFIFLLFHSLFANKQERFIYTIVPFIIILGVIGWNDFMKGSAYWKRKPKLYQSALTFFWIANTILLLGFTFNYSKKARVESMVYLSKYPNIHNLLLEDPFHKDTKMPPRFYLGQWPTVRQYANDPQYSPIAKVYKGVSPMDYPDFVLFFDDQKIQQRVDSVKKIVPNLVYETTIEPGFADEILFKMNPYNGNQTIVIYRNADLVPLKRVQE